MKSMTLWLSRKLRWTLLAASSLTSVCFADLSHFRQQAGCPFCGKGVRSGGLDGPLYGEDGTSAYSGLPAASALAPDPLKTATASVATPPVAAYPVVSATPPATDMPVDVRDEAMTPTKAGRPFPEIKQMKDGFWNVSFENLASFDFTAPADGAKPAPGSLEGIPPRVCALEGKRVALRGYMLPLKLEKELVREFLLIRSPMVCCYGVTPGPNEWAIVKVGGKGAPSGMDRLLTVYGTLHIGQRVEDGMFAGLYLIDGEKVSFD